ncbi:MULTISPECIES: TetR/AcrR family transcriptional regulator [Phenylobacterium]|uniref:TetR/AcrR family transcriptional regulator n=1 Tax=Phenylobacterium TaxID=20 RepID=UPI001401E5D8|nr:MULTISPECIES: TetR family transcriptional regulator C-terminal domain-containing protein [Phenylobacterium]
MSLNSHFQGRKASVATSAFHVLAQSGLEGFTFRAVAAASRCSLGRIVHYYPTKQELLLDAIQETGGAILEEMDEIERRLPARDALEAVLSCALPISEAGREHWRVWTSCWTLASRDREVGRFVDRRSRAWRARLTRLVTSATTREDVRDADAVSGLVTAGVTGVAMMALRDGLAPDAQIALLKGCLRPFEKEARAVSL